MDVPSEAAIMTLPAETLFPQALLRLYIFEPRYRRMLAQCLDTHRMFVVAMQRPGMSRECPSAVAGLGLIRVCVDNPDGTSHLIIQGLTRVEIDRPLRQRPFPTSRIRVLHSPPAATPAVDGLISKIRDLVSERIHQGLKAKAHAPKKKSIKEIIAYLGKINDPNEVADLVSSALLPGPRERQTILETIEIEPRLRYLINFLMREIQDHNGKKKK